MGTGVFASTHLNVCPVLNKSKLFEMMKLSKLKVCSENIECLCCFKTASSPSKHLKTTGMALQMYKQKKGKCPQRQANMWWHTLSNTHTPSILVTSLRQPKPVRGSVRRILQGTRFAHSANKSCVAAAGRAVRNISQA